MPKRKALVIEPVLCDKDKQIVALMEDNADLRLKRELAEEYSLIASSFENMSTNVRKHLPLVAAGTTPTRYHVDIPDRDNHPNAISAFAVTPKGLFAVTELKHHGYVPGQEHVGGCMVSLTTGNSKVFQTSSTEIRSIFVYKDTLLLGVDCGLQVNYWEDLARPPLFVGYDGHLANSIIAHNGTIFAAMNGTGEHNVAMVNPSTWELSGYLKGRNPEDETTSLAAVGDRVFASCQDGGYSDETDEWDKIGVWKLETEPDTETRTWELETVTLPDSDYFVGYDKMASCHDKVILLTSAKWMGGNNVVFVMNADPWTVACKLDTTLCNIESLCIYDDLLVGANQTGQLCLWQTKTMAKTWRCLATFKTEEKLSDSLVKHVHVDPFHNNIVVCSHDCYNVYKFG
jgi:hypothetical protein